MKAQGILAVFTGAACLAAPPQSSVTYYRQIAPILSRYCISCHRPGESGPFSLLTYEDAKRHASQIERVTGRRYMPPWPPEPRYGEFAGELRLTDAQIRLIAEWVHSGGPAGNPAEAPPSPVPTSGWRLGKPDLIVQAAKPFSLQPDGPDVFWNFVLSPSLSRIRYVKAIEIRPGNPRVVHHANLSVDRARSARRHGEGFPGMDFALESDGFDPESHFLFWKPGGTPWVESQGMSWALTPGSDLVLNVHLRPSGKIEAVQPSLGLYFTDDPPSKFPLLIKLQNDRAIDIPAGVRDFLVADDFRLPVDVDVLAIYPHAHYLGKLLEGFATLPDGSRQPLIRIPEWNVNWQAVYHYRKPLFLPAGTVVSMRFHYDNSTANPPRRVTSGNRSTDEMGHLWLQVLPRGGKDQRSVVEEALMRHRLERHADDAEAHLTLGTLLLARKDAESAIPHFRAVIEADPKEVAAWNNLGAALEAEGTLEEAARSFRQALHVQPDYANARGNLKDALVRMSDTAMAEGRTESAAAIYQELVELDPNNADFHNNFGIILAKLGNLKEAIAQFESALKANPSNQIARRNLDQIWAKLAPR